jgi:hypothetical protein
MSLLLFHFSSLERKVKSEMKNEGKIQWFSDGRVLRSRKPTKYFFARLRVPNGHWIVFTSISFLFSYRYNFTGCPTDYLIRGINRTARYTSVVPNYSTYSMYIPVPVPLPIPVSYRRMVILGHPAKCPYNMCFLKDLTLRNISLV